MEKLTQKEFDVLHLVIDGEVIGNRGYTLDKALRKLMLATRTKNARDLPEAKLECDYSLQWMRLHKNEAFALIQRYQKGCEEAERVFWQCRRGAYSTHNAVSGSNGDE